jgi:uncharacterized protein GlcG (DUF336 family)
MGVCLALATVHAADTKPYTQIRSLMPATASKAVTAARQHCEDKGYQVAVALTDRGGNLLAFQRNPLAGSHTVDVSILKARTSSTFQASTMELMLNDRMSALRHADGVLLLGGGLPILVGGQFYGGIGVSGAPAQKHAGDVDEECARAGIDAIKEDIEFAD